ncbi:MAG: hypothetical protein CFH01_00993 [Alphaproteobacteria bacterium MarineAlpha2_Bin1]|nr:MAG: hypothetical protein CFH01_00993 [Alphaproteobacteria bacterium MarineAlpha2_Bin1]
MIYIILQRFAELFYSNYNTKKLLKNGAREYYAKHYPFFVILHTSWIISLLIFISHDQDPNIILLILFCILQLLRFWVLISLGKYWTTRIIHLDGAKLVRKGPYRWINHPNYVIVFFEVLILPLVFGSWIIAIIFTVLNYFLLLYRISLENKVLKYS